MTTTKTKKGRIRKVKYGHSIPNSLADIDELDALNGNTLWRDAYNLECDKLIDMETFRSMTEIER